MNAVTRGARLQAMEGDAPPVEFTLDGRAVTARRDETIIEVARRVGVVIPHLC